MNVGIMLGKVVGAGEAQHRTVRAACEALMRHSDARPTADQLELLSAMATGGVLGGRRREPIAQRLDGLSRRELERGLARGCEEGHRGAF